MPTQQLPSAADYGTLTILVRPYQGRYIALCKESGLIREAATFEEARDAIFKSTLTLLEQVENDSSLEPSLHLGLSFRMLLFFYWSVFLFAGLRALKSMQDSFFMTGSTSQFRGMLSPAYG